MTLVNLNPTSTFVEGMHGLGDAIRQRALLRELLKQGPVWLTSSWVSVYYDLVPHGLHVLRKLSKLRTQDKNAVREAELFAADKHPRTDRRIRVWYPPAAVRQHGTIMAAMCDVTGVRPEEPDFGIEPRQEWRDSLDAKLPKTPKPIMLYRPLVDRPKDWTGCGARNPDFGAYAEIFKAIRDRFFVVSVADLQPNVEWIVGERIEPDLKFHEGELTAEELFALTRRAALVYCSPGFAGVMAQAVGTPVVCIFGGYERSAFFFGGKQRAPCIGIDTLHPCDCFSHNHNCEKQIDVPAALRQIETMLEGIGLCAPPQS